MKGHTSKKTTPMVTIYDGRGKMGRGARLNPPKGAQQPGKALSKVQTRNSLTNHR